MSSKFLPAYLINKSSILLVLFALSYSEALFSQNIYYKGPQNIEYHGGYARNYPYGIKSLDPTWTDLYPRGVFASQLVPNSTLPYRLYSPPASPGTKFPLFIMLHGQGEGIGFDCDLANPPNTNVCPLTWGGKFALDSQGVYPSYVLFPNVNGGFWGNASSGNEFTPQPTIDNVTKVVFELIDYMIANQAIDPNRVYLGGLSAGSTGAWELIERRPELFASASLMSGVGGLSQVSKLVNVPIWNFQGGKDDNPAAFQTQQMYEALVAAGGNPIRTNNVDRDHWTWVDAYNNPNWYKWVYGQNKKNIIIHNGGVPQICIGGTVTLGIGSGFTSYQWSKDGTDVPGAAGNEYVATTTGTYVVKFLRNGVLESSNPVTLTENFIQTPKPLVTLDNIPALTSGNSVVTLAGPAADPNIPTKYKWYKNGVLFNTSTSFLLRYNDSPLPFGKYELQTEYQSQCPSPFSDPVYVNAGQTASDLPPPSNIQVSNITLTSATITWIDNSSNELGFEVDYSAGYYRYGTTVYTNVNSAIITGLDPGGYYNFRVKAFNLNGNSSFIESSQIRTLLDNIPPTAATDLFVKNVVDQTATLSWNEGTDNAKVTSYDLYKNGQFFLNVPSGTSYDLTSLSSGTDYTFYVVAKDRSNNAAPPSNSVSFKTATVDPGVKYSYYNGVFYSIPDFSVLNPTSPGPGYLNNFDLTGAGSNPAFNLSDKALDNFALKFEALIDIPYAGPYKFYLKSDDGSKLSIDGQNLLPNDGLHGSDIEVEQSITLTAGKHPIAVSYFEKEGDNVLEVRWEGPPGVGISKDFIPDSKLFRIKTPAVFNSKPVANAGADIIVVSPNSTADLTGSGSDLDGPVTFSWRLVNGPVTPTLSDITNKNLHITGLTNLGTYTFELTVSDDATPTPNRAKDIVLVTVQSPNTTPVVNAGPDVVMTIPVNSVSLSSASFTDPDAGNTWTYLWTKVSGPTYFTISSSTVLNPTISDLIAGTYVFSLAVTDNFGAVGTDNITITVTPSTVSVQSLELIDRNSGTIVESLFDGYVIDKSLYPSYPGGTGGFSIKATTSPVTLEKLVWYIDNVEFSTNSDPNDGPPYVITHNIGGDLMAENDLSPSLTEGSHIIKAVPFVSGIAGTAYIVTINVRDGIIKWDGGGAPNNNWSIAANWSNDQVPGAADDILLDNTSISGSYNVVFDGSAVPVKSIELKPSSNSNTIVLTVNKSTIADGIGTDLTINDGGTLVLNTNMTIDGGFVSNQGTLDVRVNTLKFAGSTTGSIKSNLSNGGTSVIEYGASSDQTIFATTYENLTISGSGTKTLAGQTNLTDILTLTSGTLASGTNPGNLTIDFARGGISPDGTGALSGIIHTKRTVSAGWHYMSSALRGNTYADFNKSLPLNGGNFYVYQESVRSPDIQAGWMSAMVPEMSQSLSGIKYPDGPTDLTGFALNFGAETTVQMSGTYSHNLSTPYTASPLSYTKTNELPDNNPIDGWHLTGNPYPSFIDFTKCIGDKISSSITFYDPERGQNIVYVTGNDQVPADEIGGATQFIGPMQAYWIQTTADNASLSIPNSARVAKPNFPPSDVPPVAKPFYRTSATGIKSLKFQVENVLGGCIDQTIVRFASVTTEDFDSKYDSYKFKNDAQCPSLFSVLDNVEYAINSLPENFIHKTIPLQLETSISGRYELKVINFGTFDESSSIMLYDKMMNVNLDLQKNPSYKFNFTAGETKDRFYLNIRNTITSTSAEAVSQIHVNQTGHEANLIFENIVSDQAAIFVTNPLGQQVIAVENANISNGTYPLHFLKQDHGIYLIKVVTAEKTYNKKVLIK